MAYLIPFNFHISLIFVQGCTKIRGYQKVHLFGCTNIKEYEKFSKLLSKARWGEVVYWQEISIFRFTDSSDFCTLLGATQRAWQDSSIKENAFDGANSVSSAKKISQLEADFLWEKFAEQERQQWFGTQTLQNMMLKLEPIKASWLGNQIETMIKLFGKAEN